MLVSTLGLLCKMAVDGCNVASIQDACLITMLRISAAAEEVPQEAIETVKELHARSGRHMRRVGLALYKSIWPIR